MKRFLTFTTPHQAGPRILPTLFFLKGEKDRRNRGFLATILPQHPIDTRKGSFASVENKKGWASFFSPARGAKEEEKSLVGEGFKDRKRKKPTITRSSRVSRLGIFTRRGPREGWRMKGAMGAP